MSTVAAFGAIMTSSTPVAMGFLVIPGSEHFGVTTAQFLIYFTLFLLTSAALFGFTGRLILRIGVRPVLITGGIISALAWVGMAYAPNIYVFYIFAFIMGVGASGNNLLPANTLITGWHVHKRRGTVLGIVATGAAFGGLIIGFIFPKVMAAGGHTAADGIIGLAGAINATEGAFAGYKPLTDEAIIKAKPDVIMVMSRPGAGSSDAEILAHPAISVTPAAASKSDTSAAIISIPIRAQNRTSLSVGCGINAQPLGSAEA